MTRNVASSWRATELAINLVIARGCAQGHSNCAIVWTFAPPLLKYNLVPWCYVCDQVMYAVDTGQCAGWWWWYPFPRFCKPPPLSGYCHIPLRRSQTVCLFVIISVWPPATLLPLALLPSCQYFTSWSTKKPKSLFGETPLLKMFLLMYWNILIKKIFHFEASYYGSQHGSHLHLTAPYCTLLHILTFDL